MAEFQLGKLLHVSVIVSDTQQALAFYHDILGLPLDNQRPDLGFPGAWLRLGEQALHLLELPNPDAGASRPVHGGRDRHVAIAVDGFQNLRERLDSAGVSYTLSKSGRPALFVRDPDGNTLELVGQS